MTSETSLTGGPVPQKAASPTVVLLTPKEIAKLLKVSLSVLGQGPHAGRRPAVHQSRAPLRPVCAGRCDEVTKAQQRLSTSE